MNSRAASYQYTCESCSLKFGRKSALSKHVKMHESLDQQANATAAAQNGTTKRTRGGGQRKTAAALKKEQQNEKQVNGRLVGEFILDTPADVVVTNVTKTAQLNGSEECIMIDSSLDEADCIDGIGEPVVKVSKRKTKTTAAAAITQDLAPVVDNGIHNDGSNVSTTSSMSSRSSDIGQSDLLASLPNGQEATNNDLEGGARFENESTSASMRLSLSASEDENEEEPSLCLTNLFDENKPAVGQGGDQEMPVLNNNRQLPEVNDIDAADTAPSTLKRKRTSEEEAEPQDTADTTESEQQSEVADLSVPAKKTRLDDSSTSQQQSRSLLGKCIIL